MHPYISEELTSQNSPATSVKPCSYWRGEARRGARGASLLTGLPIAETPLIPFPTVEAWPRGAGSGSKRSEAEGFLAGAFFGTSALRVNSWKLRLGAAKACSFKAASVGCFTCICGGTGALFCCESGCSCDGSCGW
mmetsp:Transcript_9930/g.17822  ORF Transcript_9930/g.17822 Transcript_9930/m.17822 type:complete len:136 (+) Transcript_9930:62-469(+)